MTSLAKIARQVQNFGLRDLRRPIAPALCEADFDDSLPNTAMNPLPEPALKMIQNVP
jgi:hypothetical protein